MVNLYYLSIFFFGWITVYLMTEIKRKSLNKYSEITFLDIEIFYFLFWTFTYLFCLKISLSSSLIFFLKNRFEYHCDASHFYGKQCNIWIS